MAVSFQFCLNAILKRLFWIYYHCIEIPRIDISHDLLWFIGFSPPPTQSALGRVWGYSKRKTDPIFEIPTVENHRIDVLHDFFTFYSIFAVTAAAATAAPLGRCKGILKEKPISFFKSPPFKTIELMYHMIFYMYFQFLPLWWRRRQRRRPWEGLGVS